MKISRVRPLVLGTPWRNLTFVVVETDEGLSGVGEVRMLNRTDALVEAVRGTVGPDFDIFIEMHGRFSPATAIEIARELEPFQPGWLEEPVPPENLRALKKVAEAVHQPIATGERLHTRFECRELFELQACDIVQIDPSHFGGIEDFIAEHPRQRICFNLFEEDWHKRQATLEV